MISRRVLLAVPLVLATTPVFAKVAKPAKKAPEGETVRVLVEGAYPPFNDVAKNGKLVGFDVDIANALCETIGARCQFVTRAWGDIQASLLQGEGDVIISSFSMNPDRAKRFAFTKKYYQTPAKFVCRKEAKLEISDVGLRDAKLGVQGNTVHQSYLAATYPMIPLHLYPTEAELERALVLSGVDVILTDATAVSASFLGTPAGKGYHFIGPDITDPHFYGDGVGVALRPDETALRDRLDRAIVTIRSNGTYDRIARKYFNFNIYGA